MTSTSGRRPFALSVARWSTPNRCCSSITTRPSCLNRTSPCTRACVPTTRCAAPDSTSAKLDLRAAAETAPVNRATRKREGSSSREMVEKCCSARISVGAMNATCRPFSRATSAASRATIVLPAPTSPCSRRFIGWGRCKSSTISFSACRCPGVSLNGKTLRADARMRSSTRMIAGLASAPAARRLARTPI